MIDVCWHEGTDGFTKPQGRSGYSCTTLLNQMFDTYECRHWSTFQNMPTDIPGAVVVVQGGNERHRVKEISADIATLGWAIVMVIGDEGCDFPLDLLVRTPKTRVWYQMPQPGVTVTDRVIPLGPSRDTPKYRDRFCHRSLDWFFAGQVTHERRQQAVAQLRTLPNGKLLETNGFEQGMERWEYFDWMKIAKVIPCPSGPASPETLRMYEALEFGCIPIADSRVPRYETGGKFWPLVFRAPPPFPIIESWHNLPEVMEKTLAEWDTFSEACARWWYGYKMDFYSWLQEDITWLNT